MKQLILAIAAIAVAAPLAGCVPDGDSFYMPSDIAPLFGGAAVRPQPPAAQPNLTGTAGAFYAREVHGAVNRSDCQKMLERFRQEGRSIELIEVQPNTIGTGGVLRFQCIFNTLNGEAAEPDYYLDRRKDLQ